MYKHPTSDTCGHLEEYHVTITAAAGCCGCVIVEADFGKIRIVSCSGPTNWMTRFILRAYYCNSNIIHDIVINHIPVYQ